ncbi:MAG: hypothetical protein GY759_16365 [Chloroflexi bacterium]|nr:hypothetical protein [Chloroflexota bacterium]
MPSPLIEKLLFIPGLQRTAGGVIASISVGIVLAGERSVPAYWGDHTWTRPLSEGEVAGIEDWLLERLAPALIGRPLTSFPDLALLIGDLSASLPDGNEQPEAATPPSLQAISRRDLFTGKLRPAANVSPTPGVNPPFPLRPALRSCLEQAILSAAAHPRQFTVAEYVAEAYGLAPAEATLPLHARIDTHAPLQSLQAIGRTIATVGYQVPEGEPVQVLGEDCHILQRFVRGVRSHLQKVQPEATPHIHVDVRGGMAELYAGQSGKLLGALAGLEQAAKPLPLRIENISGNAGPESAALLRELRDFLRFRNMNVTLVAGEIFSAAQAATMAETTGLQSLHINGSAIGSLHQIIETVSACHERGLEVLLTAEAGATPRFLRMLAHIALATRPAFVGAAVDTVDQTGLGALYTEMARTLAAWQVAANP